MNAVRDAFRFQSRACGDLGSPFMARLMRLCADRLTPGGRVSDRVLGWEGDVGPSGASVPLRLAGALHGLARTTGHPLCDVYPPTDVSDADLWAAVEAALTDNAGAILDRLESAPQTNEVRRAAALIPALHLVARQTGLPLQLSELGCSAGLNLRADRFCLDAGGTLLGPADAAVRLAPEWTGPAPVPARLTVAERRGVDLRPLDPETDAGRLMSYLWPDQVHRVHLTEAAIAEARRTPAPLDAGDAIEWLAHRLAAPRPGSAHVVFHTVAWQYFPPEAQARGEALLADAGARATAQAPLARFAMETAPGPGAALTLQLWPEGVTLNLGRADFHGRWITWTGARP